MKRLVENWGFKPSVTVVLLPCCPLGNKTHCSISLGKVENWEICVTGSSSHNKYNQRECSEFIFQCFSNALSFKSLQFYDTEISTRMNLAFMNKEDILSCYYLAKSYKIINPAKAGKAEICDLCSLKEIHETLACLDE